MTAPKEGGAEISPELQKSLDHMAGVGCVVRYQYGNTVVTQLLAEGSPESDAWQDAAFTNGDPLVKITIEFAPDEAASLAQREKERT